MEAGDPEASTAEEKRGDGGAEGGEREISASEMEENWERSSGWRETAPWRSWARRGGGSLGGDARQWRWEIWRRVQRRRRSKGKGMETRWVPWQRSRDDEKDDGCGKS